TLSRRTGRGRTCAWRPILPRAREPSCACVFGFDSASLQTGGANGSDVLPRSSGLVHDEQVIEPAEEEIPLLGGPPIIAHLQRLVVSGHRNNVHRLKSLAQAGKKLKSNWIERFVFHKGVAHIESKMPVGLEDAV